MKDVQEQTLPVKKNVTKMNRTLQLVSRPSTLCPVARPAKKKHTSHQLNPDSIEGCIAICSVLVMLVTFFLTGLVPSLVTSYTSLFHVFFFPALTLSTAIHCARGSQNNIGRNAGKGQCGLHAGGAKPIAGLWPLLDLHA